MFFSFKRLDFRDALLFFNMTALIEPKLKTPIGPVAKILYFASSLFFSCTMAIAADNEILEIRTIGIPPYGIHNEGEVSGIYFDTANLLAKAAGYSSNNYIYPYIRIMNELKTGQTDLTIMFKYKELDKHVNYIAPMATLKTVVVGLNGRNFETIEDLKGHSIAYLRGAKFSDAIDLDPDIVKESTTDFIQGLNMLKHNRVDAIIGPLDPIMSAAREVLGNDNLLGKPLVVAERTPWVQLSKASTKRISVAKLQEVFRALKASGKLEEIREKYMGSGKP